jgi:hypothetical protein
MEAIFLMTVQISDIIKINGVELEITESEGQGLFEPHEYNINIGHSQCSACWKGYLTWYEIRDKILYLDSLKVNTKHKYEGWPVPFTVFVPEYEEKGKYFYRKNQRGRNNLMEKTYTEPIVTPPPPPINNLYPVPVEGDFFDYSYNHVDLKMNFTGVLLLGEDFISDLYVHMGYHPAWKYKKVTALCFNKGEMIESKDISEDVDKLRDSMQREDADIKEKSTVGWIMKCFSKKQTLILTNKHYENI